jgi:ATP-dependent helicase/nuclease subunit B
LLEFIVSFSTISKEFIRELDDIHNVTFGNFITSRDFVSLLQRFISGKRLRNEEVAYDTVTITSFLEARLLKFDLVIVPQMNHPYPKQEVSKFFITSQLSSEIGLPKEEALSGYCHFDLSSHMASKSFVTRSQKVSGKEEIPSLIFEKLQTLCSLLAQDSDQEKYFTWYKTQNYNQAIDPIDRPLPKPTGRPKRMSVSAIEKLMENPYGFYANYILGLKKLEPIEGQLSNREFGIATHDTIKNSHYTGEVSQEKFVQDFLNKFNQETLQYISAPEIKNFWIPRIQKIANWIWEYESNNANKITRISKEHKASFVLDDITVFAIPDRVEYMHGNAVKVVDYKTGQTPTVKDIEKGLYPQLPLEGLILQSQVGEKEFIFEYHNLKGKKESVELKKIKADMTKAEEGLKKLIATYLKGDEPFFAVCDESTLRKTRDYLHLSRVKEWFD